MDVEWDEQFGWECIDDGFSGPRMAMESVSPTNIATLAWNTLCEQIRVGKAILAVKPDDHEFLGEHPYFEVGGMVYWKTQPIPEPPAQELTDEEEAAFKRMERDFRNNPGLRKVIMAAQELE
jgi:hypothetical protein